MDLKIDVVRLKRFSEVLLFSHSQIFGFWGIFGANWIEQCTKLQNETLKGQNHSKVFFHVEVGGKCGGRGRGRVKLTCR